MTIRQQELLTYIKDYIFVHGYSPTLDEMKNKLKLGSISTVHEHLRHLVRQGYLKKNGYKRGYELPPHLALRGTLPDSLSNAVGETVFLTLSRHGISNSAASEITKNVKEDVTRLLNEHTIKV